LIVNESPSASTAGSLSDEKTSSGAVPAAVAELRRATEIANAAARRILQFQTHKDRHVLCLEAASNEEKSENPLDTLATQLTAFTSLFPSHLVALSSVPTLGKRRIPSLGSPAVDEAFATSTLAVPPSSTPLPAESYRLLTPPLILSLGIVFGLVVPLVLVVISALAGIRSPVKESAGGKSRVVGVEKKNQ